MCIVSCVKFFVRQIEVYRADSPDPPNFQNELEEVLSEARRGESLCIPAHNLDLALREGFC